MRVASMVASLIALTASTAFPQQNTADRPGPSGPRTSIEARLRAEAATLDRVEVSPLFTAITRPVPDPALRVQPAQVALCRRLESLSRDILRAWLLRGLDFSAPPEASRLEARLADPGKKLRARVFSHAEAMALECLPSAEQLPAWVKVSGHPARPRLPGREKRVPIEPLGDNLETAYLIAEWKGQGNNCDRGPVLMVFLGEIGWEQDYPGGIDSLDPIRKRLVSFRMPKINLPDEQLRLAKRLDELKREIFATWALRGLDDRTVSSRAVVIQRMLSRTVLEDSVIAHAEAIALDAIATPPEADHCLALVWKKMGPSAMLDPALSARLKLTRAQKADVKMMLVNK